MSKNTKLKILHLRMFAIIPFLKFKRAIKAKTEIKEFAIMKEYTHYPASQLI